MSSRRKSRKHAIDVLYAAELRDVPVGDVLDEMLAEGWGKHPWYAYCAELVLGVEDERAALDERIRSTARNWTLERMPAIDRAILRMAVFELTQQQVPSAAVIAESVALATELSTDDSGTFVHGVLAAVAAEG